MEVMKILKESTVSNLRSPLLKSEGIPSIYVDPDSKPKFSEFDFISTTTELPLIVPQLKVDTTSDRTRPKDDGINALLIYEYLGQLTRTQASDTRLWVTLTHTKFWEYSFQRWPATNKNSYILEHWFEKRGGGLAALRRNAISRLWWAAYLTVAPWEKDKELEVIAQKVLV